MEFKQLQSFVEVVRNKSFTKASRQLYISQPTVSMHIHQLETELDASLIVRTTKSIEVTDTGRKLYEYAVSLLAMRDRMIANCAPKNRRILSLGASTVPSAYILPKILPEFGRRYPDIYFVIHQSDSLGVISGIADGRYDLGLAGMRPEENALTAELLCEDRIILIAPVNEHFLSLKENGADAASLLASEPVILREEGSGSGKKAGEFLQASGISEDSLRIAARANDQEAIKNMVAGGLGISLISEIAASGFINEKRLLSFSLPETVSRRSFYLVYRDGYLLQDELRTFIHFLRSQFSAKKAGTDA